MAIEEPQTVSVRPWRTPGSDVFGLVLAGVLVGLDLPLVRLPAFVLAMGMPVLLGGVAVAHGGVAALAWGVGYVLPGVRASRIGAWLAWGLPLTAGVLTGVAMVAQVGWALFGPRG